jgi:hypothetical protein
MLGSFTRDQSHAAEPPHACRHHTHTPVQAARLLAKLQCRQQLLGCWEAGGGARTCAHDAARTHVHESHNGETRTGLAAACGAAGGGMQARAAAPAAAPGRVIATHEGRSSHSSWPHLACCAPGPPAQMLVRSACCPTPYGVI